MTSNTHGGSTLEQIAYNNIKHRIHTKDQYTADGKHYCYTSVTNPSESIAMYEEELSSLKRAYNYIYKDAAYQVQSTNVQIQVNDIWVPAISYTNSSGITFIRTADEFYSKFKELKNAI